MEPFVDDKNKLTIANLEGTSLLSAGISTRQAGNMALHVGIGSQGAVNNRLTIAGEIGIDLKEWVCLNQTHSTNIKKITSLYCGKGVTSYNDAVANTDGVYTFAKNILLTVQVADCVPIYFYHAASGCIGLVHAGWRGTVDKIVAVLLNQWKAEGILASEVQVIIGPSICSQCFIVGSEVIEAVQGSLGEEVKKVYKTIGNGKYKLDIKLVNEIILRNLGVKKAMIRQSKYCTMCNFEKFFSFRRDGEGAGRMLAYIGQV